MNYRHRKPRADYRLTVTDPRPSLPPNRIELWYCHEENVSRAQIDACGALLSADELSREARYRLTQIRDRYRLTRALVRCALSYYAGCPPRAWSFTSNKYGRPAIAGPVESSLDFNLSHTRGLILCAVARQGCELGVDVEPLDRERINLALARRFFAPREVEWLERQPPTDWSRAFLQFWTLKEAYIKARGRGLSIRLDRFAYTLSARTPPEIAFEPDFDDRPEGWHFGQLQLLGRYQAAVATRLPGGAAPVYGLREIVPLAWQGPLRELPPNPWNRWTSG